MANNPDLISLKPLNKSLEASWTNPPYDNIFDAFLLVVKDYDNSTIKINLTEEEALEEDYVIPNLDNDFSYSVTYNIVAVDPNGGVNGIYSSNTLTATPSIPPLAPVINEAGYSGSGSALVKFSLPSGTSANHYKSITFNIFSDISNAFILPSPVYDLSGAQPQNDGYYHYTIYSNKLITGLTYAVSSFLKNECGYGLISNTVTFIQSPNAISTPTLNYADSGLDSKVTVNFTVTSGIPNLKYTIAYKADTANEWANITGDITATVMSVDVNNLINLTNYEFKVNCFDSSNQSLYSNIGRAVPLKLPSFILEKELTVNYKEGEATGFKNSWAYTPGDLLHTIVVTNVNYIDADGYAVSKQELPATNATNLTQTLSVDIYPSSAITLESKLSGKVPPKNVPYFTHLSGAFTVGENLTVLPPQIAAGFVAVIPTQVSNITSISGRTSNTSNTSGVIQIFFDESSNNDTDNKDNNVETKYICNLYNLDPSTTASPATPLRTVTVTEENATFTDLTVSGIYYWVSVTSFNQAGSSDPQVEYVGAILTVAVPTVSNASTKVVSNLIDLNWTPVATNPSDYTYTINVIEANGNITLLDSGISGSLSSYSTDKPYNTNITFGIETINIDGQSSTMVIVSYTYYFPPSITVSTTADGDNSSVTVNVNSNSAGKLIFIAPPEDITSSPVTIKDFAASTNIQKFTFIIPTSSNYYAIAVNPYGSAIEDSSS